MHAYNSVANTRHAVSHRCATMCADTLVRLAWHSYMHVLTSMVVSDTRLLFKPACVGNTNYQTHRAKSSSIVHIDIALCRIYGGSDNSAVRTVLTYSRKV